MRRRRIDPLRGAGALCAALLALDAAAAVRDEEPVEPEQAFPVAAASSTRNAVELRFAIRDGYYLYAERFRVAAEGLAPGAPRAPESIEKEDAFVGRTRILKGDARVVVPLLLPAPPGEYTLEVTAQGCAEQRVCYAPFTQSVRVHLP
jgi:thiol:disulfide interchange protein DsbD